MPRRSPWCTGPALGAASSQKSGLFPAQAVGMATPQRGCRSSASALSEQRACSPASQLSLSGRLPGGTPSTPQIVRQSSANSVGSAGKSKEGRQPLGSNGAERSREPGTRGCEPGTGAVAVDAWEAAGPCSEVLSHIGPLRDALCGALSLPPSSRENSDRSGRFSGPPARMSHSAPTPGAKEIEKVREVCGAMKGALAQLLDHLEAEDAAAALPPAAAETDLEHAFELLHARTAQLEENAARAEDLERVVEKQKARVVELEARQAKADSLRSECGRLRQRIAELVASTFHDNDFEDEHNRLTLRVAELEAVVDLQKRQSALPPRELLQLRRVDATGDRSTLANGFGDVNLAFTSQRFDIR